MVFVLLALPGIGRWRDPLALGPGWRHLVWVALGALLASWLASPVPRSGSVVLTAVPLGLLVPAAVARLTRNGVRVAATGLVVVLLLVSLRALAGVGLEDHPRAALPLGHHNLLALWLLGLLPLAAWIALSRSETRAARSLAALSLVLGGVALVATGSLSGALGMAIELSAGAILWWRRGGFSRRWAAVALGLALLLVLPQLPRLRAIAEQRDSSVAARSAYLEAGLEGWRERPWLGQGPGATPWTVARFFEPVAGVHPPGQVLSDLHSAPLQLLYELGVLGGLPLLLIAGMWLRRRWGERAQSPPLAPAALLGIVGMSAASATSGLFATTASPLLALVLAGLATVPSRESAAGPFLRGRLVPAAAVLALASLQVPALLALHDHARARRLPAERIERLEGALRWDRHPLYAAQEAWWRAEEGSLEERGWRLATAAAEQAGDVGVLWLSAGAHGLDVDVAQARDQLRRACRLDPFSAFAPFLLAVSGPASEDAPRQLARALLLDPRLLAAAELQRSPDLRSEAMREVLAWSGVPPGWREELARIARELSFDAPPSELLDLSLVVDRRPATSLSLFTFRRQPLPTPVVRIPVEAGMAAAIELVPASTLPETARALGVRGCQ